MNRPIVSSAIAPSDEIPFRITALWPTYIRVFCPKDGFEACSTLRQGLHFCRDQVFRLGCVVDVCA